MRTCPDHGTLSRFAVGELDDSDADRVQLHLRECPSCLTTLETLDHEDTLVQAMQAQASTPCEGDEAAVAQLLARIQAHHTAHPLAPPQPAPPQLGFLAPAESAGELGRLGGYSIRRLLGMGGMGLVFEAEDLQLRRIVALKVLRPERAADPDQRLRFLREARAAAALHHDHVVTIYQVGEDRGVPFLAMECLPGETLHDRLRRVGRLEVPETVCIGRQVAEGLAAAHAHGLIHRDIKPANLWLEALSDGSTRIKILDFGLARSSGEAGLTQEGAIAGTPHFMAPEQARGEAVDHRSDLFSLGSVLYVMCTGQLPFPAENSLGVLRRIEAGPPPPITARRGDVPPWLAQLVALLHAPDPAQRPQSAAAVAQLLRTGIEPVQPALNVAPGGGQRATWWQFGAATLLVAAGLLVAGQIIIRIRNKDGSTKEIPVSPDASIEIVQSDGAAQPAPPVRTFGSLRKFEGHTAPVIDVEFLGVGLTFMSASHDGTLRWWDGKTGQAVRSVQAHEAAITSLAVSADGRRALSAGKDNTVRLWDAENGREISRFTGPTSHVNSVALSPDGRTALTAGGQEQDGDYAIHVWDVATAKPIRQLIGHKAMVLAVAFSADGKRALSSGIDRTMRWWDVERGGELKYFDNHETFVWSVAFFADDRQALSGTGTHNRDSRGLPLDCTLRQSDLQSGKEIRKFAGHSREIGSIATRAGTGLIVSGSAAGELRLWNGETGRELPQQPIGQSGEIHSVAISADGRYVLSASRNATVLLWELPQP